MNTCDEFTTHHVHLMPDSDNDSALSQSTSTASSGFPGVDGIAGSQSGSSIPDLDIELIAVDSEFNKDTKVAVESNKLTRNVSMDMGLTSLSLLPPAEENGYKLDLARAILASRQAEVNFVTSLIAEARAVLGTRQAEMKLLSIREAEAQLRVRYYSRLSEVASGNLVDAEMQVGKIRQMMWNDGQGRATYHLGEKNSALDPVCLGDNVYAVPGVPQIAVHLN
ncbi:hypothetical protein B0H10DRAFT_1967585 [Mycena sp. CBHHK59/15]|nr:hypothetical protein B0H10DRAFT_1967585 [Mycena sp. CBHHK59/15]